MELGLLFFICVGEKTGIWEKFLKQIKKNSMLITKFRVAMKELKVAKWGELLQSQYNCNCNCIYIFFLIQPDGFELLYLDTVQSRQLIHSALSCYHDFLTFYFFFKKQVHITFSNFYFDAL